MIGRAFSPFQWKLWSLILLYLASGAEAVAAVRLCVWSTPREKGVAQQIMADLGDTPGVEALKAETMLLIAEGLSGGSAPADLNADGLIFVSPLKEGKKTWVKVRLVSVATGQIMAEERITPEDSLAPIVAQIQKQLPHLSGKAPGHDPKRELARVLIGAAEIFAIEAATAWRNEDLEGASETVDVALALGSRMPDLLAMRITFVCPRLAKPGSIGEEWRLPKEVDGQDHQLKTKQFYQVLADLERYRSGKGEESLQFFSYKRDPFVRNGHLNDLVLSTGLRLLRDGIALSGTPDVKLQDRLRGLAGFDPLQGHVPSNWKLIYDFAPFLARDVAELLAYYESVFASSDDTLRFRATALRRVLARRQAEVIPPHLEPDPDRRFAAFDAFKERLRANPVTYLSSLYLEISSELPPPIKDARAIAFADAVCQRRQELLDSGELPYAAISLSDAGLKTVSDEAVRILVFYLENSTDLENSEHVFNKLWKPKVFPAGSADQIWQAFLKYRDRCIAAAPAEGETKESNAIRRFERLENDFAETYPQIVSGRAPGEREPLNVGGFWEPIVDGKKLYGSILPFPNGETAFATVLPNAATPAGAVFQVDLATLQASRIDLPVDPASGGLMLVDQAAAYVFLRANKDTSELDIIAHLDRKTQEIITRQVPEFHHQHNHSNNGEVYLNLWSGKKSGFVRLDWATNQTTILAFNERRPSLNQFDDCPSYGSCPLFTGPGGKICALIEGQPYLVKAEEGKWQRLFPAVEDTGKWPRFSEDHYWRLSTCGSSAVLFSRRGDFILVDPALPEPVPLALSQRTLELLPSWKPRYVVGDAAQDLVGQGMAGHDGGLMMLRRLSPDSGGAYVLRWFRKDGPPEGLEIPLAFASAPPELDENPEKARTYNVNGHSAFSTLRMNVCDAGVVFFNSYRGFWFLPFKDLEKWISEK